MVEGVDYGARISGFKSWLYHLLGCVTFGKLFNLSFGFSICKMVIIVPTSQWVLRIMCGIYGNYYMSF